MSATGKRGSSRPRRTISSSGPWEDRYGYSRANNAGRAYLGEAFGGPSRFSDAYGGHSAMLGIHAGQGPMDDLGARFVACFVQAADDAGLPDDPEFRAGLRAYMEAAVGEVLSYSPPNGVVTWSHRYPSTYDMGSGKGWHQNPD